MPYICKNKIFEKLMINIFHNKNDKKKLFNLTKKLLKIFEKHNNLNSKLEIKLYKKMKDKDWNCYCGFYFFGKNVMHIYERACEDLIPHREIKIKDKSIHRSILGTMLHEYGHYLNEYFELQFYGKHMNNVNSKLIDEMYIDVYNKSKKYKVINYLMSPAYPMEDFAETFIYFILNPKWLEKHYNLKYNFFIKVLHLKPIHNILHSELYKLTYSYNNI